MAHDFEPNPPPNLRNFAPPLLVSGVDENGVPLGKVSADEAIAPLRSPRFRQLALGSKMLIEYCTVDS